MNCDKLVLKTEKQTPGERAGERQEAWGPGADPSCAGSLLLAPRRGRVWAGRSSASSSGSGSAALAGGGGVAGLGRDRLHPVGETPSVTFPRQGAALQS